MRPWRLTRAGHTALDGAGTLKHGGRYWRPAAVRSRVLREADVVLMNLRFRSTAPVAGAPTSPSEPIGTTAGFPVGPPP
jgi:hypothetical protein